MSKKYFWIKLDRSFFKRHDIRIIEAMENGKDYVLFYLKLLLESIDHEGKLRFNDLIPYNDSMIATITNTNIDIVRSAIKIFQQLNMMEIWDDQTIYITDTKNMLGFETEWAKKKREYRKNTKLLIQNEDNARTIEDNVRQELEKELELDKENKNSKLFYECKKITQLYSEICKSYPQLKKLSDNRKKAIKARFNSGYTLQDFKVLFEKAESSDFLKGKNDRNWSATFDWLICDANMAKVLDGNYDNRQPKPAKSAKTKTPSYDLEEAANTSWQLIHGDNDD